MSPRQRVRSCPSVAARPQPCLASIARLPSGQRTVAWAKVTQAANSASPERNGKRPLEPVGPWSLRRVCTSREARTWRARRDSNPQPSDLESEAPDYEERSAEYLLAPELDLEGEGQGDVLFVDFPRSGL